MDASSLLTNPAISNLAISLGSMQLAKRLPMEEPSFVNKLRIGYVAAQVISVLIYVAVMYKIRQKNDLTTIKYVQPASPMSQEEPALVTTTVKDYDLSETTKAIRSVVMSMAFMGFLHLYMKYTQPLLVQGIMAIKGALESKEVMLHLYGRVPEGDLARPFKAAPGMFDALTGAVGGPPQTDAASIKDAEKPKTASKKDQ